MNPASFPHAKSQVKRPNLAQTAKSLMIALCLCMTGNCEISDANADLYEVSV